MKVFNILKSIGILFTLAIEADLVTCQGAGMGSEIGDGAGASMGAVIGAGMNGGMGGESMGQGSAMSHGGPAKIPGRNFHSGNNNPRGFMNVEYPEYTQRKKRSIMTEPISEENIPHRNKRYTVLVMPHEQNNPNSKQIQSFNRVNRHVGATKQFGRFEEIFNEKVIVQMRSKRTPPEQIPEEEEVLEMENDSGDDTSGSSSSYSDSNEENEQNSTNNNNEINKRNRRRAIMNGQNRDFKNDHQSLYKNDMHSNPIMEINKQSIIRKSFGNFVQ